MGILDFFKSKPTTIYTEIANINGVKIIEKSNNKAVVIDNSISASDIELLVNTLYKFKTAFSFYDLLYPSGSDPGAYISYFRKDNDRNWQMTLGNHGWSGGIYNIYNEVIYEQLINLIQSSYLNEIQIEGVGGFSHYAEKNIEENKKQNNYLLKIHKPTILTENYFEIGRGSKLIFNEYWHQYSLGIDLTEQDNFFVVSEIGREIIRYQKKLSFEDLIKNKWNELLVISSTKTFINQLKSNFTNNENLKKELAKVVTDIKKNKELLNGNWISIEEYDNLNYNSNFGNWIDALPIKGKLEFFLDLDSQEAKNCKVNILVNYWTMGHGYYSIIYGRFQLSKNQLLVWENDIFPHQMAFNISNDILTVQLFNNEIQFKKEKF